MDLDFAADGDLRELSAEEAWETIENFSHCQKEWDNPVNIILEQELANNPSPQSTSQILPSLEEYTPPVTYPEVVKETLGTPIEVEPLDETQLEDFSNHNLSLSSREVPSFDEPKPQPKPSTNFPSKLGTFGASTKTLANFPSLDIDIGDERGPKPTIKPYSPDSFRMKEVNYFTIHTKPSPHMASFHPKGYIRKGESGSSLDFTWNSWMKIYSDHLVSSRILNKLVEY
ncbi:hypothetical protein Tco_0218132 [Tanacetum coccineum]